MLIQIILIVALVAIAFYLMRATPSARHLAVRRMLVFLAVIGGIVVTLSPGLLTSVANAVGIGRGTDLLLYGFIVAFLLYVVTDFKRSTQLSRANTQLARKLTLTEARLQDEISRQGSNPDE